MKNRLWFIYGLAATAATLLYYTVAHQNYFFNLIGISGPLAILFGLKLHQPRRPTPWYLLALGQAFFVAGDIIAYNYPALFGIKLLYPSVADLFYLSVYPCLALGLIIITSYRLPGRDWGGFLDALMVIVSVGAFSWIFLIQPNWRTSQSAFLAKLISVAYPIMDLLVISITARLAFSATRCVLSFFVMLGAACALFITDSLYGWSLLHEPYVPGSGYLEFGWAAFYIGFGAAALHPSMRCLTDRALLTYDQVTWTRLMVLGLIALLPTGLRFAQDSSNQSINDTLLSVTTLILFVLVMLRMGGLIKLREHDAARERTLREAGTALVAATNKESIYAAAIWALRALAGKLASVRIYETDSVNLRHYRAVAGDDVGHALMIDELGIKNHLYIDDNSQTAFYANARQRTLLELTPQQYSVFLIPLSHESLPQKLLVVGVNSKAPIQLGDALTALMSQVMLALESAQLNEKLLDQRAEARFASLVKNSSDVVIVIGADTSIRYATPSVERILGYDPSELENQPFVDLIIPGDREAVLTTVLDSTLDIEEPSAPLEFRIRRRNGDPCFVEVMHTDLMDDPNVRGIVLNMRDISERKLFEGELEYHAFHDSLTGLANRSLFQDHVKHAIDRRRRGGRPMAVMFIDLDDFKTINDSLGHAAGDQVLCEISSRLRRSLRATDIAARFGGDEFAVLIEAGNTGLHPERVAERLMQALSKPLALEGKDFFVHASIGIAVFDCEDGAEMAVDELLRNADVAMYVAKDRGKSRYQVYEPAMHDALLRRLELKAELQVALERAEFALVYQPVIDLQTTAIIGAEALIRWRQPHRGMVSPAEFIPLAEETGQIIPIGEWVLLEACQYAMRLRESLAPALHVAVNLSARQLQDPSLISTIQKILADTSITPSALILEITETVMMRDMDAAIARLQELKTLGVQLAIDDFGTGYSSLNYIRHFPIDLLKIDKSFVDAIDDEGQGLALTVALVDLAKVLKLQTVAEGIERREQYQRLQQIGCHYGQGYLFSKPIEPAAFEVLLTSKKPT